MTKEPTSMIDSGDRPGADDPTVDPPPPDPLPDRPDQPDEPAAADDPPASADATTIGPDGPPTTGGREAPGGPEAPPTTGGPEAPGGPTPPGGASPPGGTGGDRPGGWDESGGVPPPPPPRPTGPSWWHLPLVRRRSGRVFGGVLSGIAAAHGIDLKLLRLVVGIGAFVFPPTIPLYLAAWLLLPRDPEPGRAPADLLRGGGRTWLALGLAFLAFLVFLDDGWGYGPGRGGNLLGAAVLLGLGAWLWSQRPGPAGGAATGPGGFGPSSVPPPVWPGPAPDPGPAGGLAARGQRPTGLEPWAPVPPWLQAPTGTLEPPRPPRPPAPPVGRVTMAVALIVAGLVVAGDRIGWYRLDAAAGLAVLLGVVGMGLVAGALLGGGRSLIAPAAVLLVLTVAAASLGRVHLVGAIGERTVRPTTVGLAENGYRHGIGQLTVDLRQLDWADRTVVDVPVDLGVGQVRVLAPDGVDLEVAADVSIGEVEALDRTAAGLGAGTDDDFAFDDPTTDRRLRLDLEVGIGQVEVERIPALRGAR